MVRIIIVTEDKVNMFRINFIGLIYGKIFQEVLQGFKDNVLQHLCKYYLDKGLTIGRSGKKDMCRLHE